MLLIISLVASVILFVNFHERIIRRLTKKGFDYKIEVLRNEVFEGESFMIRETLTNKSPFPLTSVRIDLNLPEGLHFSVTGEDREEKRLTFISGLFSLGGHESARREWRITADRRGLYTLDGAITVENSFFGAEKYSGKLDLSACDSNTVTVYPAILSLDEYFSTDRLVTGPALSRAKLVRDPLAISGVRPYNTDDPMNRINWKLSASHGELYVNNEEFTEKYDLDILLNMQSRSRESREGLVAYPDRVDLCVNVVASMLNACADSDVPISIITNGISDDAPDGADRVNCQNSTFEVLPPAVGKESFAAYMRYLAYLKSVPSVPTYDMLAMIEAAPERFFRGKNIVVVSAYFDSFMLKFHEALAECGYSVVYYITTAYREVVDIPANAEIHYKL